MDACQRQKTFSFNAGSFELDDGTEQFLREQEAISSDFGSVIYVDAERAAALFTSLVTSRKETVSLHHENESAVRELEFRIAALTGEKAELGNDIAASEERLKLANKELAALSTIVQENANSIQALKDEIAALKLQSKRPTESASPPVASSPADSSGRLRLELQSLRVQHAEAISALKVLEGENNELYKELEILRKQNVVPQKGMASVEQR